MLEHRNLDGTKSYNFNMKRKGQTFMDSWLDPHRNKTRMVDVELSVRGATPCTECNVQLANSDLQTDRPIEAGISSDAISPTTEDLMEGE